MAGDLEKVPETPSQRPGERAEGKGPITTRSSESAPSSLGGGGGGAQEGGDSSPRQRGQGLGGSEGRMELGGRQPGSERQVSSRHELLDSERGEGWGPGLLRPRRQSGLGGRGGWEPGLWGGGRLRAWHWGGWVGRPLIDFCLPAVPAGGRANRAPSINRLAASLIKTFYS